MDAIKEYVSIKINTFTILLSTLLEILTYSSRVRIINHLNNQTSNI